jgi:hypothetical protein
MAEPARVVTAPPHAPPEQLVVVIIDEYLDWCEKREHLRKLLTNATVPGIVPDDLIRLFIDWQRNYHDLHFRVMALIRSQPMSTRADIWEGLHGENVREDSAEADLFATLIHDLSTGHVIRQHREKSGDGHFLKRSKQAGSRTRSPYMKSRFDDEKPYELTELGERFIHYVMDEIVKRLPGSSPPRPGGT